ncbi:MAG TPA: type II toxin-antitoxin system VapC family toxin [Myxococcaceae bacterium]|nr:type II toxin-antitoxin system VapC family toxin [Myxococcaceae bacterium]
MTRVLLDTQAFLLWVSGSDRLTPRAAQTIADPDVHVLVSVVTAWEITVKSAAGKLDLEAPADSYVPDRIRLHGFEPLSIELAHALRAGGLPRHHGDPFDRMLVAQGQVEDVPIITGDPLVGLYDVETIW